MRCAFCKHGETSPGEVTLALARGETTVVLKGVPAEICENCGEHYLSADIARRTLERADAAPRSGIEVEVGRFAA